MLGYDAGASGSPVGEYDGAGNLIQETVWLGDIPVATLRPSGSAIAIYYVVTDQLDTPREVVRPSDNALMWSWFTGPFGVEAPNTNPAGAGTFTYDLRFPGQIAGAWGSTFQNDWRDLDPATGRFVESDPVGLGGASFSTYAYANEDPILYSDPTGRDAWTYYAGYINLMNFIENLNADAFAFGSVEPGGPAGSPIQGGVEGVGVAGIDTQDGPYVGGIGAVVGQIGGQQNYLAGVKGAEVTVGCDGITDRSFDAVEVSAGLEIPFVAGAGPGGGQYWTGDGEEGYFLFFSGGVLGEHVSVGVGAGVGAPSQNYFPIWGGAF